jgi:hypothetical protein
MVRYEMLGGFEAAGRESTFETEAALESCYASCSILFTLLARAKTCLSSDCLVNALSLHVLFEPFVI